MFRKTIAVPLMFLAVFAAGYLAGNANNPNGGGLAYAQGQTQVYELRTYTMKEGKSATVINRFRDYTARLFAKHGMVNVGYFTPDDAPLSQNTLIYILAYPSREAAQKSWDTFRKDPEWLQEKALSEASGPLIDKITSVYMNSTSFSALK